MSTRDGGRQSNETYEKDELLPLSKQLVDERLPCRVVQDLVRPDFLHLRQMDLRGEEEYRREYGDEERPGPWFHSMN